MLVDVGEMLVEVGEMFDVVGEMVLPYIARSVGTPFYSVHEECADVRCSPVWDKGNTSPHFLNFVLSWWSHTINKV